MSGYQYGVRRDKDEAVERLPRRKDAEHVAQAYANSPFRTSPRMAQLVRRRGWDAPWLVVEMWESPR